MFVQSFLFFPSTRRTPLLDFPAEARRSSFFPSHHHQTRVQPVADKQVLETGESRFSLLFSSITFEAELT